MSDANAGHGLADYAELLASSRRIDWRFLLPDPELGQVACSERADADLLRACRLFSRSFCVVEHDLPGPGSVDVLVLVDPRMDELERAGTLVRPGGWVYVEVHPAFSRRGRLVRKPRSPADHAAVLHRHGFDRIDMYWHWPSFEACTQVVPLEQPDAVRGALRRAQQGGLRAPLVFLARTLDAVGLLPVAALHASVVARRGTGELRRA